MSKKTNKPILTESEIKKRKTHKKQLFAAVFVLLIAVGVTGNWYYQNSDIASKIQPLLSSDNRTLGEAKYVNASTTTQQTTENEYFSSARVDRENARSKSIENLQKVVSSADETDTARKEAEKKLEQISSYISIENKIETLVTSKGVKNCLAVINDDGTKVDIIVDVDELSDNVILQIKDIAMEQLNCDFADVTIIQSK